MGKMGRAVDYDEDRWFPLAPVMEADRGDVDDVTEIEPDGAPKKKKSPGNRKKGYKRLMTSVIPLNTGDASEPLDPPWLEEYAWRLASGQPATAAFLTVCPQKWKKGVADYAQKIRSWKFRDRADVTARRMYLADQMLQDAGVTSAKLVERLVEIMEGEDEETRDRLGAIKQLTAIAGLGRGGAVNTQQTLNVKDSTITFQIDGERFDGQPEVQRVVDVEGGGVSDD